MVEIKHGHPKTHIRIHFKQFRVHHHDPHLHHHFSSSTHFRNRKCSTPRAPILWRFKLRISHEGGVTCQSHTERNSIGI